MNPEIQQLVGSLDINAVEIDRSHPETFWLKGTKQLFEYLHSNRNSQEDKYRCLNLVDTQCFDINSTFVRRAFCRTHLEEGVEWQTLPNLLARDSKTKSLIQQYQKFRIEAIGSLICWWWDECGVMENCQYVHSPILQEFARGWKRSWEHSLESDILFTIPIKQLFMRYTCTVPQVLSFRDTPLRFVFYSIVEQMLSDYDFYQHVSCWKLFVEQNRSDDCLLHSLMITLTAEFDRSEYHRYQRNVMVSEQNIKFMNQLVGLSYVVQSQLEKLRVCINRFLFLPQELVRETLAFLSPTYNSNAYYQMMAMCESLLELSVREGEIKSCKLTKEDNAIEWKVRLSVVNKEEEDERGQPITLTQIHLHLCRPNLDSSDLVNKRKKFCIW